MPVADCWRWVCCGRCAGQRFSRLRPPPSRRIILYAPVLAVALPADIVGHLHRDAWLLPALTALNTVIVVLVQVPLTSALRRHGDVAVLRLGALLLAASYAMFLTAGLGVAVDAVLVVAAVVYTFGEVLGSSPAQSALATLAPLGMTGRYLAALQLSSGLARASAPVIFGLCLTVGRGALWLSLTGLLLASALALGRQRADSQHRFETAAAQLADVA
jgi:MFS family permease